MIKKIKLIKDPIWGDIPYSEFEQEIFSSLVFNRLHFILQNALAFFVYPSLKTSRFSHSIGTAHCASLIFQNAIKNTIPDLAKEFLTDLEKEIKNALGKTHADIRFIIEKLFEIKYGKDIPPERIKEKVEKLINEIEKAEIFANKDYIIETFGAKFLSSYSPPLFLDKKETLVYYFALQIIRFLALTHDIGHLPLSHLLEDFINEYVKVYKDQINNSKEKLLYKLNQLIEKLNKTKTKLHEYLGKGIRFYLLFYEIPFNILSKTTREEVVIKKSVAIFSLGKVIVDIDKKDSHLKVLKNLKMIIDYDIDADRIDYIQRDGKSSGLLKDTGDVGRIIKQYVLTKVEEEYKFLPTIQSLNDITEVIIDRFRDYQYVISHHKVLRLNGLLKEIFFLLAEIEKVDEAEVPKLGERFSLESLGDIFKLISLIEDFYKVEYKNISFTDTKILFRNLNKLNDYWIFEYLRTKFFEILLSDENGCTYKNFRTCANEFFSTSKTFVSLWKRFDDFKILIEQEKENIKKILEEFPNIISTNENLDDFATINRSLASLIEIVGARVVSTELTKQTGRYILVETILHLLKPSIDKLLLADLNNIKNIYTTDQILQPVKKFLRESALFYPLFFVFVEREVSFEEKVKIFKRLLDILKDNLNNFKNNLM